MGTYHVYKYGCIVSTFCTRSEAMNYAVKLGYNKELPDKLNNIHVCKERVNCRTNSVTMRVKNSRNTYNKMEYAGTGYGCEL